MGRLALSTVPIGFIEKSCDFLDQFNGPISVRSISQLQRHYLFPLNNLFDFLRKPMILSFSVPALQRPTKKRIKVKQSAEHLSKSISELKHFVTLLSSITVLSDSIHIGSISPSSTIHLGLSLLIDARSRIMVENKPRKERLYIQTPRISKKI